MIEYPQSGERIVGDANRRRVYESFPGHPSVRRIMSSGNLAMVEAAVDYGDDVDWRAIFIIELRDTKIAKLIAYWARPFPPAQSRALFVERANQKDETAANGPAQSREVDLGGVHDALRSPRHPKPAGEEDPMFVVAVHQTPSLTQERYEEVVRRLTNGKSRFESASDLPFDGLLFHAAGQGKNGFCVVDVFESEEAVERFNEAMASIPREVGIEQPPDFFPAHTFVAR